MLPPASRLPTSYNSIISPLLDPSMARNTRSRTHMSEEINELTFTQIPGLNQTNTVHDPLRDEVNEPIRDILSGTPSSTPDGSDEYYRRLLAREIYCTQHFGIMPEGFLQWPRDVLEFYRRGQDMQREHRKRGRGNELDGEHSDDGQNDSSRQLQPPRLANQPQEYRGDLGNSLRDVDEFRLQCETAFRIGERYFNVPGNKAKWVAQFLRGDVALAWDAKVREDGNCPHTWEEMFTFLADRRMNPDGRRSLNLLKFCRSTQRPSQSARSFYLFLENLGRELPQTCTIGTPFAGIFVSGLTNTLRDSLIHDHHDRTLLSAADLVVSCEQLEQKSVVNRLRPGESSSSSKPPPTKRPHDRPSDRGNPNHMPTSNRSHRAPSRNERPLSEVQCYNCQAYGHYATACPKEKQTSGYAPKLNATGVPILAQGQYNIMIPCKLSSEAVSIVMACEIDTAAEGSFIASSLVARLQLAPSGQSPVRAKAADGSSMAIRGAYYIAIALREDNSTLDMGIQRFLSIDMPISRVLLGQDWLR